MTITLSLPQAVKLGSLVIHAEEATRDGGHAFDLIALRALIVDPEVQAFLATLGPGLLPVRRSKPSDPAHG